MQSCIPILPSQEVTREFTKYIVPETVEPTQKNIIVAYVLLYRAMSSGVPWVDCACETCDCG